MLSPNLPGTLPKETFGVESLIAIHLFFKDPKHILMLGKGVLIAQLKNVLDKTSQQGKERLFHEENFLKYPDRYEDDRYLKKEITCPVEYLNILGSKHSDDSQVPGRRYL